MKLITRSATFVAVAFVCCVSSAQETEIVRRDVPPLF